MRVEEERQPLAETIHVQAGVDRGLHVRDRMCERERHFLNRGRSGLADVIPADRDRVPVGQLALAEGKDVGDDSQRMARRIDVRAARDVFLQDVVLHGARKLFERAALALRDGDVEREQDDRGRIDRHRRRHAIERDAVEERGHVLDGIDRDADATHLAGGERMIGVVPHLRRQIEGDTQAADALREQVPVARVRFGGCREAGVLPHRPQSPAVHRRLDAAREGKLAGRAEGGVWIPATKIVRCTCVLHSCHQQNCIATFRQLVAVTP